MMIYIVFEECDDPYASRCNGNHIIFDSKDKALQHMERNNYCVLEELELK